MKILIAADHAGVDLKNKVAEALRQNYSVEDLGPFTNDSVDYPDYADLVCRKLTVADNQPQLQEFGVLICGSAQGMAMRANKFSQVRAALVYGDEIAKLSREHNNANIICIGARFCSPEQALNWIRIFAETPFAQGRHQTRVAKVSAPRS